jgi:Holliday junction resolvase
MRYKAKADANQPQIVKELRAKGCVVKHIHQLKNFADLLVGYKGVLYLVEVKQSHKHKLTPGELECKELFNSVSVPYLIITTANEFFKLIE